MASSFGVLGLLWSTRRVPQCPGTEFSKPARHSGFSGSDREPLTKHVDRERLSISQAQGCAPDHLWGPVCVTPATSAHPSGMCWGHRLPQTGTLRVLF